MPALADRFLSETFFSTHASRNERQHQLSSKIIVTVQSWLLYQPSCYELSYSGWLRRGEIRHCLLPISSRPDWGKMVRKRKKLLMSYAWLGQTQITRVTGQHHVCTKDRLATTTSYEYCASSSLLAQPRHACTQETNAFLLRQLAGHNLPQVTEIRAFAH